MDIANWFGCYLYSNQDSCSAIYNGWCNNKVPTGQAYGCQLFMSSLGAGNAANFDALWTSALSSGDPQRALSVPWGQHNGTWREVMDEIKRRGQWAVKQREAYFRSRGISLSNSAERLTLV